MSFMEYNYQMLSEIGQAIAEQFGSNCEVVLHDLTKPYDQTIIAIWNGYITGRKVGDGGTDAGLKILRGNEAPNDQYGYINYLSNGRIVRSTSKYFLENGKVVGSMCINLDITDMMRTAQNMKELTTDRNQRATSTPREFFTGNVDELLDAMLDEEIQAAGVSVADMSKADKVDLVSRLDERGAFLIRKAAERVAERLNITKFTVYNYLNETNGGKSKPDTGGRKDA